MKRVILESPFGQNPDMFTVYGRACVADSIQQGEAPMAMHLLYTQPGILNDQIASERARGMEAAFMWYPVAEAVVVYRDFGISNGMQAGIDLAISYGLPILYRSLRGKPLSRRLSDAFPRRSPPLVLHGASRRLGR